MTVEQLHAIWESRKALLDSASAAQRDAARDEAEARLHLLDAEGRAATALERAWLRAWLDGNHAECRRLLAVQYPEQHRVALAEAQRIAEELPATTRAA